MPVTPSYKNLANRGKKPLARRLLSSVLVPLAKIRTRQIHRVKVLGYNLIIHPTVFDPSLYISSTYFAEYILKLRLSGKQVLEIGTGSGLLSLAAAAAGANSVIAVDIHVAAVDCAGENVLHNNSSGRISVLLSDQFDAVLEKRFDLIISNPPYYSGEPFDSASLAWMGGGHLEFFRKFAAGLPQHLNPEGSALIVLSEDSDLDAINTIFLNSDLRMEQVDNCRRRFEYFYIFSISPIREFDR